MKVFKINDEISQRHVHKYIGLYLFLFVIERKILLGTESFIISVGGSQRWRSQSFFLQSLRVRKICC